MSRVIGGSASNEAYTRMLEEQRQKNTEKMYQQYHHSERIRSYNDDATYRQSVRTDTMESQHQDSSRKERRFGHPGYNLDVYA
ncbi:hypothetical protein [Seleniivibrio woodruffii]|uniref:hypothetical protein n=1 Tax=Seleniivibrio woodruffii TaxID=1078050 RepID=UPI0026ED1758|nr:hypothetical protein [Seleniivibrio woodruffii]